MRLSKSVVASVCTLLLVCASGAGLAAEPTLSVRVHPRVGLFNEIQYRGLRPDVPSVVESQKASWTPLDRKGYVARATDLKGVLGKLGDDWDILTTFEPSKSYALRRARLTLEAPPGSQLLSCHALGRPGVISAAGKCHIDVELKDNSSVPVAVAYQASNVVPAGGVVRGTIPEDFLIVIAGDSFASGEGNPDRPCPGKIGGVGFFAGIFSSAIDRASGTTCSKTPAIWMDEQCNRSMWAAGMRSALEVIEKDSAPGGRNGAYTVVNLACSGARVLGGLIGPYAGVQTREQVRKNHARELGLNHPLNALNDSVPGQLLVLDVLLTAEASRPKGKRSIDILIMSGGGNDLEFGRFVLEAIKSNSIALSEVEKAINEKLTEYSRQAHSVLAGQLAKVPADLLLFVPYPDITGKGIKVDVPQVCEGAALPGIRALTRETILINSDELGVAYRTLVVKLNDENRKFADNLRFRVIDRRKIDAGFADGGWCAKAADGTAYENRVRLLRKADESLIFQGNEFGTMHPTFQGHQVIAKAISEAIDDAFAAGAALSVRLAAPTSPNPSGGPPYTSSPLRFELRGSDSTVTAPHEICWQQPGPTAICGTGFLDYPQPHGTLVRPMVTGVHKSTRRHFVARIDEMRIDAVAPAHKSCRLERSGTPSKLCDSSWIVPGDILVFSAEDSNGSGLDGIGVALQGRNPVALAGVFDAAAGETRIAASDLPGGLQLLHSRASDKVGNASLSTLNVRVDQAPPTLVDVRAYGHSLAGTGAARSIPAIGAAITLELQATDKDSGIRFGRYQVKDEIAKMVDADSHIRALACLSDAGPSPSYAGTVKVDLSAHRITPMTLWVNDCAERDSAALAIRVLRIAKSTKGARSSAEWVTSGKTKMGQLHRDAVAHMTSLFSAVPDASDQGEMDVFATWLNLADGRVSPAAPMPLALDPGTCSVSPAAPAQSGSLYAFLMGVERCVTIRYAAEPTHRSAFLMRIAASLKGTDALAGSAAGRRVASISATPR